MVTICSIGYECGHGQNGNQYSPLLGAEQFQRYRNNSDRNTTAHVASNSTEVKHAHKRY